MWHTASCFLLACLHYCLLEEGDSTNNYCATVTGTVTVMGTFGARGLLYSVVTVTDRPILTMGDY